MKKAIVMSILVATFWIPLVAARDPKPSRGLQKVRKWTAAFCVLYVLSVLYLLPRL